MKTQFLITALSIFAFCGAVSCNSVSNNADSDEPHKIGIIAHRGYWNCEEAGYARNSVASLRCAQEYGFWGSEFDVQLTSDEVIIICHNDVIEGKDIAENPYSEFADMELENGEKIPTIDDYFSQAVKNPKTVLVCDFKGTSENEGRLMELTFAKMREYGLYDPNRIVFTTNSGHISDYIAREMPKFVVEYSSTDRSPEELLAANIKGVNYEYHTYENNPDWCDIVKANGMRLKMWTLDKEDDMRKMIGYDPDFITSNDPLLLRNVLREMGVEER